MNRDVRGGLVLLCIAGIFVIVGFATRPDDDALYFQQSAVENASGAINGIGIVIALGGLIVIIRGLLRDRD